MQDYKKGLKILSSDVAGGVARKRAAVNVRYLRTLSCWPEPREGRQLR